MALFITAMSLIFRKPMMRLYDRRVGELPPALVRNLTILTGAVLGVLVSISSVGAGAIGVTALILLYPKMPTSRIVGSDIAHAVPLTLVAGLGHWVIGLDRLDDRGFAACRFVARHRRGQHPGLARARYRRADHVGDDVAARLRAVLALQIESRRQCTRNSGSSACETTCFVTPPEKRCLRWLWP